MKKLYNAPFSYEGKSQRVSQAVQITLHDSCIRISGVLNQHTAMYALEQAFSFLIAGQAATLDLRAVTRSDSAGLAFLTVLLRKASKQNISLTFEGMPQAMCDLASVSGILPFLPIVK